MIDPTKTYVRLYNSSTVQQPADRLPTPSLTVDNVSICRQLSPNVANFHRFETSVIDEYIDFKPFYEQYDEKRRKRLLACAKRL